MKVHNRSIASSFLFCAVITFFYVYALTQMFDLRYIELYRFATWSSGVYILLLPLVGLLCSIKEPYKTSLICSIGIPLLFILIIYLAGFEQIRIPVFGPDGEYNESIRFALLLTMVAPIFGAAGFGLAYVVCLRKLERA